TGETPISKRYFRQKLMNRGVSSRKGTHNIMTYYGVRLKPQEKEQKQQQEATRVELGGMISETPYIGHMENYGNSFHLIPPDPKKSASASSVETNHEQKAPMPSQEPEPDKYIDEVTDLPSQQSVDKSTEPSAADRLSELQRRGDLSHIEQRILAELQRAGAAGKTLYDIATNLGLEIPLAQKALERLKSLSLVEEAVADDGLKRWRLAA
ncbi:MAG TPA: hypothetical protein PK659_08815, partial [Methanothrix sp.]